MSAVQRSFVAIVVTLTVAQQGAAAPTVSNIPSPALQIGATSKLVVDGGDLAANPRLLLPVPIASQSVRAGSTAAHSELDVTLDPSTPAGIYLARLVTDTGMSAAFPICLDGIPTEPFAAAVTRNPVALTGDLTGGAILRTTLAGKAGQHLVVEVEARRLGSKLNPVLRLFDAPGKQLAWSQGVPAIADDARIDQQLPADGQYTIELHDMLYRGAASGRFRLKIGDVPYADLTLPLGAQRGIATPLQFLATNISTPANLAETPVLGIRPAPWPSGVVGSGSRPRIEVTNYREVVETQPPKDPPAAAPTSPAPAAAAAAGPQQLPAAPLAVSGRLLAAHETDRYLVPVSPGTKLRVELLAERIGSPIDGVVAIADEQGRELATGDDSPGTTDPALDFTVPSGASALVVSVRDLTGSHGAAHAYRLQITPADAPDFTLAVGQDTLNAPASGRALLRVAAARKNYAGPIQLAFDNLPAGASIAGDTIPAGAPAGLVVITAGGAPGAALITLRGTSADATIARYAMAPETPVTRRQPWLRESLALAITPASPLTIDWAAAATDADRKLPPGGKLPLAATISRAAGTTGQVRLTLVTSQVPPQKKVDNKMVDDTAKALRLEAPVTIAADQTAGAATLLVPADLPPLDYDVVLQAELLGPDNKTVTATAVSSPRRVTLAKP
jgi:hypothetical protein